MSEGPTKAVWQSISRKRGRASSLFAAHAEVSRVHLRAYREGSTVWWSFWTSRDDLVGYAWPVRGSTDWWYVHKAV